MFFSKLAQLAKFALALIQGKLQCFGLSFVIDMEFPSKICKSLLGLANDIGKAQRPIEMRTTMTLTKKRDSGQDLYSKKRYK